MLRRGFRLDDKIYSFIIVVFRYCQSNSIINNALCDNWNIYHVCCFLRSPTSLNHFSVASRSTRCCRFSVSTRHPRSVFLKAATFLVLCVNNRKSDEHFHPRSTSSDFFLLTCRNDLLRPPSRTAHRYFNELCLFFMLSLIHFFILKNKDTKKKLPLVHFLLPLSSLNGFERNWRRKKFDISCGIKDE